MKKLPIIREFAYSSLRIPDPNPSVSVEDAAKLLSASFPELVNVKIEPMMVVNRDEKPVHVYRLSVATGTKG